MMRSNLTYLNYWDYASCLYQGEMYPTNCLHLVVEEAEKKRMLASVRNLANISFFSFVLIEK